MPASTGRRELRLARSDVAASTLGALFVPRLFLVAVRFMHR
jgi:hypothetical protein